MSIEHKTDYATEATETLLPAHPFGAPGVKLKSVITALMVQIQAIEDDVIDLAAQRDYRGTLSGVEGVHLDYLGKLIGQGRKGTTDTDYRVRLLARMIANGNQGTPDAIISVVFSLIGAAVLYTNAGAGASYLLEWEVPTSSSDALIEDILVMLRAMSPAGVSYEINETPTTENLPVFRFDDGAAGVDLGLMVMRVWVNG